MGDELTRYEFMSEPPESLDPYKYGEWVRYEDADERIAALRAEVERLSEDSKRLDWLLAQARSGEGVCAIENPSTGFFINRPVYKNGELYDRKRIAYAPRGESWRKAIDNAIAGLNPDDDIRAEIEKLWPVREATS